MMAQLSAIILAAGRSTRMQDANKLLLPFGEKTILETVVSAVAAAGIDELIVVTGFEDRQVRAVLQPYNVRVVYNPEYAAGLSTSLRRGIMAASPGIEGYMICLADMPTIQPETYRRLNEVFSEQTEPRILIATAAGERGNPVVFHRAYQGQLLALTGDQGGKSVILDNVDAVVEVDVADPGIYQDIDTRSAYDYVRHTAQA